MLPGTLAELLRCQRHQSRHPLVFHPLFWFQGWAFAQFLARALRPARFGRQMRVLTVIKSEKIARGPFQSRSALVHTPRTQGHLPGSPSQEASGRDRSAPSGVGQIRFGVGFLQGAQWFIAGWSSPVARQAHNLKVTGSNPVPATTFVITFSPSRSNDRGGFPQNAGTGDGAGLLAGSVTRSIEL